MASRVRELRWGDLREFDALLAASLIWFLGQFVRYVFPPLFETFRGQYGVSNTTLGLLFSVLMAGYAGMQFPSGAIADRIGTVRVITVGVLLVAGAGWVLVFTDAFLWLGLAMLLLGIGSGFHKTVAIALLSIAYPERTGRTLGTLDTFGQFGGVAAPAVVVAVLSWGFDWRLLFVGVGLGGVGLGALFYRRANRRLRAVGVDPTSGATAGPADTEATSDTTPGFGAYLAAFRTRRFLGIVVVAVTFSFTWTGITAFLPLYLTSAIGVGSAFAGLLYSSIFAVSLIQPVAGELSDRIGHLPVMAVTLGLAGLALGTLITAPPVLVVVAVPLIGVGYHSCRPARDAYLVEAIPDSVAGGTLGLVRTLMMGMGAVAPALVGVLSDVGSFQLAFGVLLVALAGSIAILLVLLMTTDRARRV